jgi:DNA-binding NarL/FixJ family response regulator
MPRSVLVVDDHATFRAAAARLLEAAGFTVVGEAADVATAKAGVALLHPDVVLLDVQLPDGDGFTVARWLAREAPDAAVVLTSSRDASDYRDRMARTRARGFISKSDLSPERFVALVGAA